MSGRGALLAAAALVLAITPTAVLAQSDKAAEIAQIRAEIAALNARLDKLERQDATAAAGPGNAGSGVPAAPAVVRAPPTPPAADAAQTVSRTLDQGVTVAPATNDRVLKGPGSTVEFSATKGATQVSLAISSSRSVPSSASHSWARDHGWSLTLAAPLSKGDDSTSLATLDALASGASLKFQLNGFAYKTAEGAETPQASAITQRARDACLAKKAADGLSNDECKASFVTDSFIEQYDKSEYDAFIALFYPPSLAFAYGVEGGVGYNRYTYLDPATAKSLSASKVPFSAKVFVSVLPYTSLSSVTGAFEYSYAYKEAKSSTLCPAPTGPITQCPTGPVGAPSQDNAYVLSLEYRRIFQTPALFFTHQIGVSAQVSHDFASGVTGVDVPIYLAPDAKGNLLGGLRLGYTSDKNAVSVGVFVGSTFSIFQ